MSISLFTVILLAIIQGAAELLPVSSSAHVIVAEHLLNLDPSAPQMTFLLVMLHTGTMGAVLVYFWKRWRDRMKSDGVGTFIQHVVVATVATGIVGLVLKKGIEHVVHGDVETLFGNLHLIAAALLAAGVVILWSSRYDKANSEGKLSTQGAVKMGLIQGLCLPFRGFSRSGATISVGLMDGLPRSLAEDFSFALAVVLTPAAIALEGHRLLKHHGDGPLNLGAMFGPGLLGMVFSFAAGLVALRLLSAALEQGRWKYFGYYCIAAAVGVSLVSSGG